jgi:hypothetical protein
MILFAYLMTSASVLHNTGIEDFEFNVGGFKWSNKDHFIRYFDFVRYLGLSFNNEFGWLPLIPDAVSLLSIYLDGDYSVTRTMMDAAASYGLIKFDQREEQYINMDRYTALYAEYGLLRDIKYDFEFLQ